MEEYIDQLLRGLSTLVNVFREALRVALKFFILRGSSRAARYRRSQVSGLLLLPGSRITSGTGSLGRRGGAIKEARSVGVEVLVRELLDQAICSVVWVDAVGHSRLISGLRGLQVGLAVMRLGVSSLWRSVVVWHKISLAIDTILSIHIVLRTLALIDRLRKRRRGGRVRAIVCSRRIEGTLIVAEVQVGAVIVGIHLEEVPSRLPKSGGTASLGMEGMVNIRGRKGGGEGLVGRGGGFRRQGESEAT